MPVYDFRCRDCGAVSEVFVRGEQGPISSCPSCGSANLERKYSGSYAVKVGTGNSGNTCCGREERCDSPPCHTEHGCHRR